jgi:multiple sugar transport system substrate-binding protein
MKKRFHRLAVAVAGVLLIAVMGCSNGEQGDKNSTAQTTQEPKESQASPPQPVELSIFVAPGHVNDADFQLIFTEPLKKKYPHITLKAVRPGKGSQIGDLVNTNQAPDLVYTWNGQLADFITLDLVMDQTPLIKSNRLDTSRFDKQIMDTITYDTGVLAIPFTSQFYATYYNKDIFDKFGIPYPKDGMLWEETIELSKRLTRTESGVQYKGLFVGDIRKMAETKSLAKVDPTGKKAIVNTDGWRQIFDLVHRIYSIPGNGVSDIKRAQIANYFMKDKFVAMAPFYNILPQLNELPPGSLNWDIAQFPSYPETPNTYQAVNEHIIFVAKSSKYKEDAFKVLLTVTADDVQLLAAKQTGRLTPLTKSDIRSALGDYAALKGRNYQGILKSKFAPSPKLSEYEAGTNKIIDDVFADYLNGKFDVNTALREAEEKINAFLSSK